MTIFFLFLLAILDLLFIWLLLWSFSECESVSICIFLFLLGVVVNVILMEVGNNLLYKRNEKKRNEGKRLREEYE